jgi:hypothetical protein
MPRWQTSLLCKYGRHLVYQFLSGEATMDEIIKINKKMSNEAIKSILGLGL